MTNFITDDNRTDPDYLQGLRDAADHDPVKAARNRMLARAVHTDAEDVVIKAAWPDDARKRFDFKQRLIGITGDQRARILANPREWFAVHGPR